MSDRSEPENPQATETLDPPEVTTLLGQGSEFNGKLSFEGAVRIDGRFQGEIVSEGTLVVGQAADIEADVMVRALVIQGRIAGSLTAQEAIELRAPARVKGTLIAPQLSMEKGVIFNGSCEMSDAGAGSDAEAATEASASTRSKANPKKSSAKKGARGAEAEAETRD